MEDVFALTRQPIVFVDFETTGFNPQYCRVIEVGAVRWDEHGRHVFSQLANPGVDVPAEITRLTGLTTADVADAPPVASVMRDFHDAFLHDTPVIVAHNAPFDLGFLDAELARVGLGPYAGPFACTLRLSRQFVETPSGKHRLADVCAALDVSLTEAHRSLADVEACEQVFRLLWPLATASGRKPWRRRRLG